MRRWLLLLVPAVLLLVLLVVARVASSGRTVMSGTPGDVVYAAAFDDFLDEWQQYADGQLSAQVEAGELRLTVADVNRTPFSLARPRFASVDLRVDARAVDGPENNGFGVVLRAEQPERASGATWGALLGATLERLVLGPAPDARLLLFLVSSDGYYSLQETIGDTTRELSTWIPSDAVRLGLGTTNRLRVLARDGELRFFANDTPLPLCIPDAASARSTYNAATGECMGGQMLDAVLDPVGSGRVGVAAQSFMEPGVVVAFDNLVVKMPE